MKSSKTVDVKNYILMSMNNKYCTSFKQVAYRRTFKQTKLGLVLFMCKDCKFMTFKPLSLDL